MSDDAIEPISKTKLKQEAQDLKQLGRDLVALPIARLEKLPIDERLLDAILQAKKITSNGAIRRQAQLIGKLMRGQDCAALQEEYQALLDQDKSNTAVFHDIEQWRTRLVADEAGALTQFISDNPEVDIQHLRQLIRKAQQDAKKNKNSGAFKEIFRLIRSCQS